MTSAIEAHRAALRKRKRWRPYLLEHSGLPGPRGNIELAKAVAEEGDETFFTELAALGPEQAPTGTSEEFLAFCGVLGLGTLVVRGRRKYLADLRKHASDPRWRIREAVAMALQRAGQDDLPLLAETARTWSRGGPLEQRAAAAALCEPALLRGKVAREAVFEVLSRATRSLREANDRSSDELRALRQGLGYCWSVAVAAYPKRGQAELERWLDERDPDIRWMLRENLRKKRLERMDSEWVAKARRRLEAAGSRSR